MKLRGQWKQVTQVGRTQFRLREREIHHPVNLRWDERCAR